MVCAHLSNGSCRILAEKCFRIGRETCDFFIYYNLVTNRSQDPPLTQDIKARLEGPLIQRWKDLAKSPARGKKDMSARPFEEVIRATVRDQLSPLGVIVPQTGKKYPVSETVNIIADCLAQKDGYPTCILSMKTWVGTGQVRETFAFAYFAKRWHGQKNIRVYMVIFQSIPALQDLMILCKPDIDGIYSLTGKPTIDDLVDELKGVYASPKSSVGSGGPSGQLKQQVKVKFQSPNDKPNPNEKCQKVHLCARRVSLESTYLSLSLIVIYHLLAFGF
jgi:hypothetical protein